MTTPRSVAPPTSFSPPEQWLIEHRRFEAFIIVLILLNSLALALTDYNTIVSTPSDPLFGMPSAEGSWRNAIMELTEPIFTAAFAAECALKIVAMGFCLEEHSYLRSDQTRILLYNDRCNFPENYDKLQLPRMD